MYPLIFFTTNQLFGLQSFHLFAQAQFILFVSLHKEHKLVNKREKPLHNSRTANKSKLMAK